MRSLNLITLALSGLALAKDDNKPDKGEGRYVTTVSGRTYSGDKYKEKDLACQGTVTVRGINNGFDLNCANMNLYNYAFTGANTGGRKCLVDIHMEEV